jgi:hypothetical protein
MSLANIRAALHAGHDGSLWRVTLEPGYVFAEGQRPGAASAQALLDGQSRMAPPIGELVNQLFYNGALRVAAERGPMRRESAEAIAARLEQALASAGQAGAVRAGGRCGRPAASAVRAAAAAGGRHAGGDAAAGPGPAAELPGQHAGLARARARRSRPEAPQTAAVTTISTFHSGLARPAMTVARGGVWPAGTQASQAAFMPGKSARSAR